jgi:hypothetical protein
MTHEEAVKTVAAISKILKKEFPTEASIILPQIVHVTIRVD